MEQKGQEKEVGIPNSIGYNPSSSFSDTRSRENAGSGNVILSPVQTLNQHNHHSQNAHSQLNSHQLEEERDPNLDPDPLVTAINRAQLRQQSTTSGNGTTTTSSSVRYRECLKNHAASMGGHVLDGCGEFMPSEEEEEEGTPQALKCAACNCHRNFHRREIEAETQIARARPPYSTFNPPIHNSSYKYSHSTPSPVMMTFGGNAESSSEDLNLFNSNVGGVVMQPNSKSKKRFRTKFTAEQKERMHEFAEKVGWSIQKQDEQELQHFCNEVGVKRQVFRIWMHNS